MTSICVVCKIEFDSARSAKTCSPKCRVTLSRSGVTKDPNVTLAEAAVTRDVTFEFTIKVGKISKPYNDLETVRRKELIRTSKYWYNVPLAAVPVIQKGWPDMPEWMNGRQYFLWWKNEFAEGENGPILHNPFPRYENIVYHQAGDNSRRWGA